MAGRPAGIEERRQFLMWLGGNHELKQPAALDILRYFLASPGRLSRVRPIVDCSYLRPLIVIAARGCPEPGLLYQTALGSSRDPAAILMDLAITCGPVYLAPFFPRRSESALFAAASEEPVKPLSEVFAPAAESLADRYLAQLTMPARRAELVFLIDQALERGDQAAFKALVAELKRQPPGWGLIPKSAAAGDGTL